MQLKHFAALVVAAALGAAAIAFAQNASELTARNATSMPEALYRMNGSPILRFTTTPDDTTAETNASAAGGGAIAYTLVGGERLCFQTPENALVQVTAGTFAAARAFTVYAAQPLQANCITLKPDEKTVSTRCSSGSCTGIQGFEIR